jgi:ABC-type lipoprotein release transport system permease subunit
MEKFLQDLRTYFAVYMAVILLLSLIAMLATLGPAMRATRVDLTTVLRQ